jgi:membrane protein DedA with SNARE-associated domain
VDSTPPTPPPPAPPAPRRRSLALLLVPIIGTTLMTLTGTALAPALLAEHPLLLVSLNPAPRHLVLATNSVDALPFFSVALARLFFPDPFYYLLGRAFGADAIEWIERRSGASGKFLRSIEKLFARAGVVLLFIAPAGLMCVLAGAARMRPGLFVAVNLLGTLTGLLLVRAFGAALADPIEAVRQFVQANVIALTLASVLVVMVSSYLRRRRARRLGATSARARDVEL